MDLCAFAFVRTDFELSADQLSTLGHVAQAEGLSRRILQQGSRFETDAVVAHDQPDLAPPEADRHSDGGGSGMALDVVEGLLADTEQRELDLGLQPPLLTLERERYNDAAAFGELVERGAA